MINQNLYGPKVILASTALDYTTTFLQVYCTKANYVLKYRFFLVCNENIYY